MNNAGMEIVASADVAYRNELHRAVDSLAPQAFTLNNGGSRPSAIIQVAAGRFFIKRHLSPKIPVAGERSRSRREARCAEFINRLTVVINRLDCDTFEVFARPILLLRNYSTFLTVARYVPGQILTPAVFRRLNFQEQALFLSRLAAQIEALHGVGLVHMDVQPSNIVRPSSRADGHASLIDIDNCTDADSFNLEGVSTDLLYIPQNDTPASPTRSRDSYAFAVTVFALVYPRAFRSWARTSIWPTGFLEGARRLGADEISHPWSELIRNGLGICSKKAPLDISDIRRYIPELQTGLGG